MPTPDHHLLQPAGLDAYRAAMADGVDLLASALARAAAPGTGRSPAEAARAVAPVDLDRPLGDRTAALAELRRLWLDDAVWFHDPGYAAHLNPPVVVPALLAEVLVAGVNASLDTYDQSVGATFVERAVVEWTAGRIGFACGADGVLTSGGSQSNLEALLIARNRAAAVPLDRMRVLVSADGHFSIAKSAHLLGLPDDAVVAVAVDDARRLDPRALSAALARCADDGVTPIAVVATAGTTDFGAIDPLPDLAALARAHGAWLHVDAAYGGGLLVSRRRRHLLAGIELADSVTVDFHKTWFQPVSASALVVRDGADLAHVAWHADYLNPRGSANPNQVDKSLQTTRRFDALKVWLTLRIMGPDAVGDAVDAVVDLAHAAHAYLADDAEIAFAAPPSLSTLVLRFETRGPEEHTDAVNERIRAELWREGASIVASTRVDGRTWLKLTLLNPAADLDDVLATVERIRRSGRALCGRPAETEAAR